MGCPFHLSEDGRKPIGNKSADNGNINIIGNGLGILKNIFLEGIDAQIKYAAFNCSK